MTKLAGGIFVSGSIIGGTSISSAPVKTVVRNKRSDDLKSPVKASNFFDQYKQTGKITQQQKHFLLQQCKNKAQQHFKFSKSGNTYTINGVEVGEEGFNSQLNWIFNTCDACFKYGDYIQEEQISFIEVKSESERYHMPPPVGGFSSASHCSSYHRAGFNSDTNTRYGKPLSSLLKGYMEYYVKNHCLGQNWRLGY